MRPIKFTPQELVDRIKELKVVKIGHLAEYFGCSIRTLFNKMERHTYYTSYNFNRQYITLKEIPVFDENGIWEYQQVRFSKWRNVEETIRHIVDKSSDGITPHEIAENLQIRTHNQLLGCREKGMLVSKRYGRNQVYYSADKKTQEHQMEKREAKMRELLKQIKPKQVSDKMIINVLIAIIKHHETKPENIASILSSEGKGISERSIRWVIEKYEIKKKGVSLRIIEEIHAAEADNIKQAQLIGDLVPVVDFYPEPVPNVSFKELSVLKTTTRTMHTIQHRTFIARQIYLYQPDHKYADTEEKKIKKYASQELHAMVRGKSGFTMEVVCATGMLRFIKNKSREETQEEIYREYGLHLSTGTISNLSLEFLIRFEMYHNQHFNLLVDTMKKDGGYILGADGTGDGGSDRILLLMDLIRGWSLSCSVIPSEKEDYITPLFKDLINKAGDPLAFVRDMGCGLHKAGEKLFSDILTKECNFHFMRDAGKDMMTENYQELKKVMVRLKVRSDLAKLRKTLNYEAKSKRINLRTTMQSLRENAPVEDINAVIFTETYHLTSWILNYAEESHCQRFPYSLPWVYLYKRCQQGMNAISEILSTATNANSDISYIKEVQKIIERPFHDKTTTVLADLEHRLKREQDLFLDLREALKIPIDKGDIPRGNLFISDEESLEIEISLKKLRDRLSLAVKNSTSTPEEEIVLEHLIRHGNWLGASNLTVTVNGEEKKISIPRAISLVDARFSQVKSSIRKRTGKKDTGRELNRYGALLCLLQNLHSEEYVKVMFNSIENISNAIENIPKEEVDKAIEEFKNAQCRYDVTCARGDNEFETFINICKRVLGEVMPSTVEKSHNLLIEVCDPTSILTDS